MPLSFTDRHRHRLGCKVLSPMGKISRIKRYCLCLLLIVIAFTIIGTYKLVLKEALRDITREPAISKNYFLAEEDYNRIGFLVNSTVCQIPFIQPWDPAVLPFTSKIPPVVDCNGLGLDWTYVNKSAIVINETAITKSGHIPSNIFCCYRSIQRDEKLKNIDGHGTYSRVVDSRVVYSSNCTSMELVTYPTTEFIFVTCEPKYLAWYYADRVMTSKVIYRNFHALIPKAPSAGILEKVNFWKEKDRSELPNVILLGIDATSRMNFQRRMPKTIDILNKLGAHEMLGYAKVGENTWPNLVALQTGYDEDAFEEVCYFSRQTKLDMCPFIWKRFSSANYLTSEIQDYPRSNLWNLEKTGFVEPPTDFYFRPLMVAIHMNAGFYPRRVECVGKDTMEKFIWDYVENIIQFGNEHQTPVFVNTWLTQLAHDNLNTLQFGDEKLALMLERLSSDGSLDNSILILASDHGYRYGGIRQTLAGYYEDKLPMLWIRLPPSLRQKVPQWESALLQNSRCLSSPFDLYKTLNHILDTFANSTTEMTGSTKNGREIKRSVQGTSLLSPLNCERRCDDVGIPHSFCPCHLPIRLPIQDSRIQGATAASLKYLNSKLPPECSPLDLKIARGGALLNHVNRRHEEELVVQFITSPGNFLLETTVRLSASGFYTVQSNVQRLSQFESEVTCINDQNLQLYCHCI